METVFLLTVPVVKNCPPKLLGVYTTADSAAAAMDSYNVRFNKEHGYFPSGLLIEEVHVNQEPFVPECW